MFYAIVIRPFTVFMIVLVVVHSNFDNYCQSTLRCDALVVETTGTVCI